MQREQGVEALALLLPAVQQVAHLPRIDARSASRWRAGERDAGAKEGAWRRVSLAARGLRPTPHRDVRRARAASSSVSVGALMSALLRWRRARERLRTWKCRKGSNARNNFMRVSGKRIKRMGPGRDVYFRRPSFHLDRQVVLYRDMPEVLLHRRGHRQWK